MQNNIFDQISSISTKIGVPTKKIIDVFYYLRNGEKVENYQLIRFTGISKNAINTIKEMFSDFFEKSSTTTQIKKNKISIIKGLIDNNYLPEESLLNLKINLDNSSFLVDRQDPLRKYDQFYALPKTVLRRAQLLNFLGDIVGKRILFLGDDDFTSLAITQIAKPSLTHVVDIDDRILNAINEFSNKNKKYITTLKHDLRQSLPTKLLGKFDVVFTDPPYTPDGMKLFMSRAVSALDSKNLSSRIYVCYGVSDRAKERFIPIYNSIVDSGLMIRHVFDKFNRYTGAESIGSTSSLFVLETTPKTRVLIKGNYEKPIYTND